MWGRPGEQSPGKKDPHLNSSLLLSLGTVFFVLGSVLCYTGDEFLTGFLPPYVGAMVFYLGGLMLYLMNAGKPSHVGHVVSATGDRLVFFLPQQAFQGSEPHGDHDNKQHSDKEIEANRESERKGDGPLPQ